jgi:DNA-binding NarL/FixJ family response regulator
MSRLRALLADDHTLVRAGLRKLLESMPDVEVVGEASDGLEACCNWPASCSPIWC